MLRIHLRVAEAPVVELAGPAGSRGDVVVGSGRLAQLPERSALHLAFKGNNREYVAHLLDDVAVAHLVEKLLHVLFLQGWNQGEHNQEWKGYGLQKCYSA